MDPVSITPSVRALGTRYWLLRGTRWRGGEDFFHPLLLAFDEFFVGGVLFGAQGFAEVWSPFSHDFKTLAACDGGAGEFFEHGFDVGEDALFLCGREAEGGVEVGEDGAGVDDLAVAVCRFERHGCGGGGRDGEAACGDAGSEDERDE